MFEISTPMGQNNLGYYEKAQIYQVTRHLTEYKNDSLKLIKLGWLR